MRKNASEVPTAPPAVSVRLPPYCSPYSVCAQNNGLAELPMTEQGFCLLHWSTLFTTLAIQACIELTAPPMLLPRSVPSGVPSLSVVEMPCPSGAPPPLARLSNENTW